MVNLLYMYTQNYSQIQEFGLNFYFLVYVNDSSGVIVAQNDHMELYKSQ